MDSGLSPYCGPVADLVDPYATKDLATEAGKVLRRWLHAHPGRWAMFAEGDLGIDRKSLMRDGYEVSKRNIQGTLRFYARLPHPQGESLQEALARTPAQATFPKDLPDLQRDSFEWTAEELQQACRAARENLFPVSGTRGRGKK